MSIAVAAILWILVSILVIYFYFVFFPKMILDCMQTRLNTLQEQLVALHDLKSFSAEPTTLDDGNQDGKLKRIIHNFKNISCDISARFCAKGCITSMTVVCK